MATEEIENEENILPIGSTINKYRIEKVLGRGGFGVTYLAHELDLNRKVALKECLPHELAFRRKDGSIAPHSQVENKDFDWAKQRFIEEAQTLAKFNHPAIVSVYSIFETNGTGYMATRYEEGLNLEEWIRSLKRAPTEAELNCILKKVMEGLLQVHAEDILHRDIKPENIYINSAGDPILLDFGSARQAVGSKTRPVTAVLTPGYAPFEQYHEGSSQGPWTDIYSLAAVVHRAITGKCPQEATLRIRNDPYVALAERYRGKYRSTFLNAIDTALNIDETKRPQNIKEWEKILWNPSVEPIKETKTISKKTVVASGNKPRSNKTEVYNPTQGRIPDTHTSNPAKKWFGVSLGIAAALAIGFVGLNLKKVEIEGNPNDAKVYLNDKYFGKVGERKLKLLWSDSYEFEFRSTEYQKSSKIVDVGLGTRSIELDIKLNKIADEIDEEVPAETQVANNADTNGDEGSASPGKEVAVVVQSEATLPSQTEQPTQAPSSEIIPNQPQPSPSDSAPEVPIAAKNAPQQLPNVQTTQESNPPQTPTGTPEQIPNGMPQQNTNTGSETIINDPQQGNPEKNPVVQQPPVIIDQRSDFEKGMAIYQTAKSNEDYQLAAGHFQIAAENGNVDAQYQLGLMKSEGKGFKRDQRAAIMWFEKAAKKGHLQAQLTLANYYHKGIGVSKNIPKAVKNYTLAAKQGAVSAQRELGMLYDESNEVSRNYYKAYHWYRLAAAEGDIDSQYGLGRLYRNGRGVEKNRIFALACFMMAADQGDERAERMKNSLSRVMSMADAREAGRLSVEGVLSFETQPTEPPSHR